MLKPSIQRTIDAGLSQMAQNVGVMVLQFMELCVKAEPMVLTNITILTERGALKIEECADVTIPQEKQFQIFLRNPGDLPALRQAIFNAHPEFLFSTKPAFVYEDQSDEEDSLIVTMPDVTKERRDVLKHGAEAYYKSTQARVEVAHSKLLMRVSQDLAHYPEDMREAKDYLEMNTNSIKDKMRKLYDDKICEIENAYEMYKQEQAEEQQTSNDPTGNDDENVNGSRLNVEDWKMSE